MPPAVLRAADDRSDELARAAIFTDVVVAEDVEAVRRRTRTLDLQIRYRSLLDGVLPSETHDTIRMTGAFTATRPVPDLIDDHPVDVQRLELGAAAQVRRIWTGGNLVSPAYDLINVAGELGQLDPLRERVESLEPEEELQIRCRLALLALIDLAREDLEGAAASIDGLDRRVAEEPFDSLHGRWPETLVVNRAVDVRDLRLVVEPLLMRMLTEQFRKGRNHGPANWDTWLGATVGRMRYGDLTADRDQPPSLHLPPDLAHWIPVSRGDSVTRGRGFAASSWLYLDGEVHKLASHQDEYLYYRLPLRGNYVLECELTGFNWFDCFPMVGGVWTAPMHAHDWLKIGGLDGLKRRIRMDPLLSRVDHWIRYRVVVEDGTCTTYINARQIDRRKLSPASSPWIAFYSPHYGFGNLRNVRISGDPIVPRQVDMSGDESLAGWIADQHDSVGGDRGDWRFDGVVADIVGRRKQEFGGWQESQLRYHRQMVEDGTIEYEFWYSPSERCHAHPSIGRKAFLLEPDGLAFHWITDGVWDRSELDPLNRTPAKDRSPLPLVEGWNRLRLELAGDAVTLYLNEQKIDAGTLHPTNDRTFGLFHYADQTEVRVRNMIWEGGWPDSVPPVQEQQLRDGSVDELDRRREELTATFEHDFERDGFSPQRFATGRFDAGGNVVLVPDGLEMIVPGTQGYRNIWVAPRLEVSGDFDIIAEFEQLDLTVAKDGDAAAYLVLVATDPLQTHARVWHGAREHPGFRYRRISRVEFNEFGPGARQLEFAGEIANACVRGRMRIAREGKRMTFMIAEEDSDAWRVLHSRDVTDLTLQIDGVRLCAGTYSNAVPRGKSRVVWKRLSIRAEQIIDPVAPQSFLRSLFGGN